MTRWATVAKYLSRWGGTVSCVRNMMATLPVGVGLRSLGFPLDVSIENDAFTFNTVHLAGLAFLLRDAIGDHAAVFASNGPVDWECLWGSSWFFKI